MVKTKKTELLFIALFLRLLRVGGRAAVIVPDGVMFGSSKAHKELRRLIVEEHKLDAVIKMPSGVFKPYAGVSTAILLFTRTDTQEGDPCATDTVWFYDMQADGLSLDDKRQLLVPAEQQGVWPVEPLSEDDHAKNNLPDILARWGQRDGAERDRTRTDQSFCVSKEDIEAAGYDLSLNRYKEIEYEEIDYPAPKEIIADLREIEKDIAKGLTALEEMLG